MQEHILLALVAIASGSALMMAASTWRRLSKSVDSGTITVIRKTDRKAVRLPRNYSPAAVEELLELTA